jgi:hypothetical protein
MGAFPGKQLMKNSLSKKPAEASGSFELGAILGQRKAFSMVAGRCSAAEAAAIRRIREERLYQASKIPWKDFCPLHLGMSRTQADRLIQLLEEFGPDYFEVTQLTRVCVDTYRAIAPAVRNGHIHWLNESIALTTENSEKVTAAIAGLLDTARSDSNPGETDSTATAPPTFAVAMAEVKQHADRVVAEWAKLVGLRCSFRSDERQTMKNLIAKTRLEMERLERQVWNRAK